MFGLESEWPAKLSNHRRQIAGAGKAKDELLGLDGARAVDVQLAAAPCQSLKRRRHIVVDAGGKGQREKLEARGGSTQVPP
jgi:hypothetical protein